MVCVEAGLDQSPQGESERWCPHRPLPPPPRGRDDAMRRFVPIDIGRVLPGEHLCARTQRARRNPSATLLTSTERTYQLGEPGENLRETGNGSTTKVDDTSPETDPSAIGPHRRSSNNVSVAQRGWKKRGEVVETVGDDIGSVLGRDSRAQERYLGPSAVTVRGHRDNRPFRVVKYPQPCGERRRSTLGDSYTRR